MVPTGHAMLGAGMFSYKKCSVNYSLFSIQCFDAEHSSATKITQLVNTQW